MKAKIEEIESILSMLDEEFDKNPYTRDVHERLEHVCEQYLAIRLWRHAY